MRRAFLILVSLAAPLLLAPHASARARFLALMSCGPNRLRIAMSVNQAGVGYLAAFSREITYRRAC